MVSTTGARRVRHHGFFSGRYKALHVEGNGTGYLRTVPIHFTSQPGARPSAAGERLIEYPLEQFSLASGGQRASPGVDVLGAALGEHGITRDDARARTNLSAAWKILTTTTRTAAWVA